MSYSFGKWVRSRRKALDLTQRELAHRVGCSLSAIFKIESDERRPSRQVAELLAAQLEVPTGQRDLFLKVARQEKTVDNLATIPPYAKPEPFDQQSVKYGASTQSQPIPVFHPIPTHLPLPLVPLIGREHEFRAIIQQIQNPACRLLTLTGQGGIGKTHLALHLGSSLESKILEYPIAFVNLTPLTGREQMVTAVADALGIVLYSASDRASQLISYLHSREQLLILDNFEHLLFDAGCSALISEILYGTQNVKIVTTSRQPLQLQAEWVFEVQGLPVPKSKNSDELESNSAVTLFVQRAKQAAIGFTPTNDDMFAIAQICERVEGLPLGIELAAAWTRALSCREIATEIQNSMDFLATSVLDIPERQRSIRATIDYSWRLLSDEEQKILSQLSIFHGGFSRQAAEDVAGASLLILSALISKSLLRRVEPGRFDMHELIHQYAWERLQENSSTSLQIWMKYSQYFANLLQVNGPALKGPDRPRVVAELVGDIANLRQAWHWASSAQQAGEIIRSADPLFWLYESRSNCREGIPLFDVAVESLRTSESETHVSQQWERQLALGQALSYKGFFLFRQGKHPQGHEVLKSSLSTLRTIPENDSDELQMAISNAIVFLGTVISVMGDFAEGDRLLQEGLNMKRSLNDLWGSAFCLRQIGLSVYHYLGDYDKAYEALEQSLILSQELGNTWSIAASLSQLGFVAYSRGEYSQAKQYLLEGLKIGRALEDRASIAFALDCLGLVAAAQGQYDEAQNQLRESIALWGEIGEQGSLAQTLTHFGDVMLKQGDIPEARKHFHHALSIASETQVIPVLLEALIGEAEIQVAEGMVESALETLTAVSQNPSSSFAARARAEKLRAKCESR